MSYRFKRTEAVPEKIPRIVIEQLDDAHERLCDGLAEDPEASVHGARKDMKKAARGSASLEPTINGGLQAGKLRNTPTENRYTILDDPPTSTDEFPHGWSRRIWSLRGAVSGLQGPRRHRGARPLPP